MPSFDLVFEGGGAKGTAFAGALGTFWFLTQMYARFWNDLADHASA